MFDKIYVGLYIVIEIYYIFRFVIIVFGDLNERISDITRAIRSYVCKNHTVLRE